MLSVPDGEPIYYIGPSISAGIKPAVIYFALSAETSLFQDPFNQPAIELAQQDIRVFSWDLPFHTKGADPHTAMSHWAEEFAHNPHFISHFISLCQKRLDFLLNENLIDRNCLAVAGLSRGGFMATHLAAHYPTIKWVLGFAPLTAPEFLQEFPHSIEADYSAIHLTQLADQLTQTHVRFYIGNHDTRVKTEACFTFIKTLTEKSFAKGVRSPQVELIIYPSIGHKGHGTSPEIFKNGASWLKDQLINRAPL